MHLTCQQASMQPMLVPVAHKDCNNEYCDFHFLTACIDFYPLGMCRENENVVDAPPSGVNLPGKEQGKISATLFVIKLIRNPFSVGANSQSTQGMLKELTCCFQWPRMLYFEWHFALQSTITQPQRLILQYFKMFLPFGKYSYGTKATFQ
jgi:hypothetical protein